MDPSSPSSLRFFKIKTPNSEDKSEASIKYRSDKSSNSVSPKKNEEKESVESENSITASVSEHIVENDSAEASNDNESHRGVSIPSLHIKSVSKTESDSGDLEESKNSSSHDEVSRNEEAPEPPIDVDQVEDCPHISDESSIHTQFDLSLTSSKNASGTNDSHKKSYSLEVSKENDGSVDSESLQNEENNNSEPKESEDSDMKVKVSSEESTLSEDVIKLDIRGTASSPLNKKMLFFGNIDFLNLQHENDLIAINDKVVDLSKSPLRYDPFNLQKEYKEKSDIDVENSESKASKPQNEEYEQDYATEELILNESRDIFPSKDNEDNTFASNNVAKQEGESSLSTVTTEYKTFGEDLFKVSNFQEVLLDREQKIVELHNENEYLSGELMKLQDLYNVAISSGAEVKGQLSDFVKNENMQNDDVAENFQVISKTSDVLKCSNYTQTDNEISEIYDKQRLSDLMVPDSIIDLLKRLKNNLNEDIYDSVELNVMQIFEKELNDKCQILISNEEKIHKQEINRLRGLLISLKSNNPEVSNIRNEVETKYKAEMEELRMYYEKKCSEIYSEEIISEHSKKISAHSSLESMNICPDAILDASPVHRKKIERSQSADFEKDTHYENLVKSLEAGHQAEIKILIEKYESQISDLKADLQTYQNTEVMRSFNYELRDTDLELEKDKNVTSIEDSTKRNDDVKNPDEVLLSDPNMDSLNGHLNLIVLRNKIEADAMQTIEKLKAEHAEALTTLREENSKQVTLVTTKENEWRHKRYEAFDKNRHIEDVVKERDGLKRMTINLQQALSQLVNYFNLCEEEVNNAVIGEFIKQVLIADENFDNTIFLSTCKSPRSSPDQSLDTSMENVDHNSSALSRFGGAKMHFAPDISDIMTYIDPECSFSALEQTQNITASFQDHLDTCLKRLRIEAQELVALTASRIPKRLSILPSEEQKSADVYDNNESADRIPEYKKLRDMYEQCELIKKDLEVSLGHSKDQELLLREQLQLAIDKIAELENSREVVSEGYGVMTHPRTPLSLPPHPRIAITSPPPLLGCERSTPDSGRSFSMDAIDKKSPVAHETMRRLTFELEAATKDKEDLQMQLEAANKQLKSTRQFLEEQAAEREQERDEFQKELDKLKEDNNKLTSKTQHHTRICNEVDQLEVQMRDMSSMISTLEERKNESESELKASTEKNIMLNDIIGNLESQLELKTVEENKILEELNDYKRLTEEQELKISNLTQDLERVNELLSEKIAKDVLADGERHAASIANELETEKKLVEQMRAQLRMLVETLAEHTSILENLHEAICSQSCSSPSEDVSLKDLKKRSEFNETEPSQIVFATSPTNLVLELPLLEMSKLGDGVHKHLKAEDAAIKRISDLEMQLIQLKDVAQELRAERDVLQERMSEQSLRISSLQSRLDQTRHTAEAMTHQSTEDLRLQLDEALSETQLLREALDSRDKQVARLKALVESTKKRLGDQEQELSACGGPNKDIIQKLKRELHEQQCKNRELLLELEENRLHHGSMPELFESIVADKDADIDHLKKQLIEKERHLEAVLSLKIDEDVIKNLSMSEKDAENQARLSARTLSDIISIDEFDEPEAVRRIEVHPDSISGEINLSIGKNLNNTSVPVHNTLAPIAISTVDIQELESPMKDKDEKRENEIILLGTTEQEHSRAISDNCSLYPNKDASADIDHNLQPKLINFSMDGNIRRSLEEIGLLINFDENDIPNVIMQLKNYICDLQKEVNAKQLMIIKAEEQLVEFPHLRNEVDELKNLLQNSLETMEDNKSYYNAQLETFAVGEEALKKKLEGTMEELKEKAKELQVLKEDIVRREQFVMELAKDKHALQSKLVEIEVKCKLLENETGNDRLQNMIAEKNQQIDSLNVNLDKLEGIQKELNENKDLVLKLNAELEKKSVKEEKLSNEVLQLKDEMKILNEERNTLTLNLSKLESDLLSGSRKEIPESELLCDNEFEKIKLEEFEEFKELLDKLTSPRSPISMDLSREKQKIDISKIRQHISNLKSKLASKEEELNITVFELERVKLEVNDLKSQNNEFNQHVYEKNKLVNQISAERDQLESKLKNVLEKLNEEGNLEELHDKLMRKSEECVNLEYQVANLRNVVERYQRDAFSDTDRDNQLHKISLENEKLKQQVYDLENSLTDQDNLITELNEVKNSLVSDIQILEKRSEEEKDTSAKLQALLDTEKKMTSTIQSQDSNVIQLLKSRLEEALDSEEELKIILQKERKAAEQLSNKIKVLEKQLEQTNPAEGANNDSIVEEKLKNALSQLESQVDINELMNSEVMLQKTKYNRAKSRLADLQNVLDREKLYFQKEIDASKEQAVTLKTELSELMKVKCDMHSELVSLREKLHFQINENLDLEKRLLALQESRSSPNKLGSHNTYLASVEQHKDELAAEVAYLKHNLDIEKEKNLHLLFNNDNESSTLHHLKEMQALLKRHISENVQISETVKELTRERKELQSRVRELENQHRLGSDLKHSTSLLNIPGDVDKQVSFLYGRYMRLHSYRKMLVWQKQFLIKMVSSYEVVENLIVSRDSPRRLKGIRRFKSVVIMVKSIYRMKYLARKWHTGNKLAANMHLNIPNIFPTELKASKSYTHIPVSPTSREKTSVRPRYSLNSPTTLYQTLETKPANRSWSIGSAVNSSRANKFNDRIDRFRSNNLSDNRWHHQAKEAHPELLEERCLLRSPTSGTEASSALSGYLSGIDVRRHRILNSRDPL